MPRPERGSTPDEAVHSAEVRKAKRWRRMTATLLVPLIGLVLFVGLLMILEESLIFFPSRYPQGDWSPPGMAGLEDAEFAASDGTRLHGWFLTHDHPRAVILFSHGNAGNLSHRAETLRVLNEMVGASVMIYDYRGYGKSEGRPNEAGVVRDARAARAWLARRAGIDETQIVLMGRSLGGAVSVELAAEDGARGLVLENTFTSIPEMAAIHYPWLPLRSLIRNRFDALAKIGRYHGPLLQSHADADRIVPYEMGRRLHAAANEPKQFLALEGLDHNDPPTAEYYEILIDFLQGLP